MSDPAIGFVNAQEPLKMPFIESISVSYKKKKKEKKEAKIKTTHEMWDQRPEENNRKS